MLTIFDCDGVLIDSEIVSAEVTARFFNEIGFEIGAGEVNERFVGMTGPQIMAVVETEIGRALPDDFEAKVEAEIDRRLARVKAVAGVHELLDVLEGPRCICSNSSLARLKISLEATRLWDRFKPYVFSAGEVRQGRGKPHPDVFLHAAEAFGVEPSSVVVIEDSTPGVTAAAAAGMRVVGFVGGAHTFRGHGERLMDAGAETVIRKLSEVPAVVDALRQWDGIGRD
jgi:HAD superfamily hydrolase (TIGR01509 family)